MSGSGFIGLLKRIRGWRLWVAISLVALLAVEIVVAGLDELFKGRVINTDMLIGFIAVALVEPIRLMFTRYLPGEPAKESMSQLELMTCRANSQLKVAIESSQLTIWEMDYATGVLRYDATMLAANGFFDGPAPRDFDSWLALIHPDDRAEFMCQYQSAIQPDGKLFDCEYRIESVAGVSGWLHTRGEVIARDAAGAPILAVGSTQIITERKQAEFALQNEKQRFKTIFNHTPEMMIISRLKDGCITHVNEAILAATGYSREQVLGRTTLEMGIWQHDHDRQKMTANLAATGRCHNLEVGFTTGNGSYFTGLVSAVVTEIDGEPHIVAAVRDISEQKRIEEQLKDSETLLRSTLESTDEGVLMIAHDGKVLSANKRFIELWHVPPELQNKHSDDLLLAHVLDQLVEPEVFINQVQRLYGSDEEARDILYFKDGRVFARYTRALKVGEQRGRIWCFRDISEQTRAQIALAESEAKFRSIFTQASDGILLVDADSSRIVEFNDAACTELGYSREEFVRFSIRDIQAEYDVQKIEEVNRKIQASGGLQFETKHRRKNGSTRIVQVSSKPIRLQGKQYLVSLVADITERKQHEQQLRASEQKMRTILDNVDAFIYLRDTQGKYLFANRKVRELWHAEMDDIVGCGDEKFFDAATAANIRINDGRVLLSGETIKAEETNTVLATGKTFTYLSTKMPLRMEDGGIVLCGISTDITERISIERALRLSEWRLHQALEASQMGVWELDLVTRKLYWSDEIFRYLGLQHFEPTLEFLRTVIHPDDADIPHLAMSKAINERCAYFAVYRLTVGGKIHWAEDRGEVQFDAQGKPLKVIGTVQDISARKNIEQALAASEVSLKASQLIAGLGTYMLDIQSGLWSSSAVLDEIFGIDASYERSVAGWENLIHEEDRAMMHDYFLHEVIGKKSDFQNEYRIVRRSDNAVRWVHGLGRLEWDSAGNPRKMFGTIQDITARKESEAQLRSTAAKLEIANLQIEEERARLAERVEQRTAQLSYANKAKDSFLATMSHEIRTPLGGMLGMMEMLGLSQLDAAQRETLSVARKSGLSLLRIVDDILDWSKIEAGKLQLAPRAASLAEMLRGVVNTYAQLAKAKHIALREHTDAQLAAAYVFDPLRLSQILNNFTSNAIKFTAQGSIELSATLLSRHDGYDKVRFSVRDSGVGIDQQNLSRLFQHYEQASADTARMYGGTGLGLSISRSLADLMEGVISVESTPGDGSTFSLTIDLPVAEAMPRSAPPSAAADSAATDTAATGSDALVGKGQHVAVLMVDDHPVNRMLLKQQLGMLGFHVEAAADGAEALALWQNDHFDLVITDCHMPEMDGYELARCIRSGERESGKHVPIIAWTANVLAEEEERCRSCGMDDMLTKPTGIDQLREKLSLWLDKAGLRAKLDMPAGVAATPVGAHETPALDLNILRKVAQHHDAQVELLREFDRQNQFDLAALLMALRRDDLDAVQRTAHRIKGASRMMGALQLESICTRIEAAAKQGDLPGARSIAETSLEYALDRLKTSMQGHIGLH